MKRKTVAELEKELRRAVGDLRRVHDLIFSIGAPLGSEVYFAIREILARYEPKGK